MDRKPFRILAVAGSLRQGSYNRGLLRAAQEVAPDWVEVQFFDIGQLPFFNEDVEAACGVVGTRSLDVRAMCQNAPRHVLKAIPLFEEIIPYMVANLVNQFAVRVGDLGDMWSVDKDFAQVAAWAWSGSSRP